MFKKIALAALIAPLISFAVVAEPPPPLRETVTPVFQQEISNIPGKSLVSVVVNYAPGASSVSHRHAASAFIYVYVLTGEIRSQVGDAPAKVYKAGETFFEKPGERHRVSENASTQHPASLLATIVVDSNERELTTPDKQ
jgi:quercetin dioxygenase-like cupin family protein